MDGARTFFRFAPDGKRLYHSERSGESAGIWAFSLIDGSEDLVVDLVGQRGILGWTLDTDGQYVYFMWQEDLGDIWVMDVVTE